MISHDHIGQAVIQQTDNFQRIARVRTLDDQQLLLTISSKLLTAKRPNEEQVSLSLILDDNAAKSLGCLLWTRGGAE